ncbi:nitroreductase family protein [Amycolatopsis sp. NPDC005003]
MSTVETPGRTPAETEVLVRAMTRAPSVRNTQPWFLEAAPGELLVRAEPALPRRDPHSRDRTASCGAALCEDLGLTGFPQALLRIGYAAEEDPPSPRRAVGEVLHRGP